SESTRTDRTATTPPRARMRSPGFRSRAIAQPLPAFQKRWMPVAAIDSPAIVTRTVGAALVWWTARTGWKPSAPVVLFWDSTRSPTRIDSIGRGPSMVWTRVPAPKHSKEADQLEGGWMISVNVGLVVEEAAWNA